MIEFYNSKSERTQIIDTQQALGFYVKNDDFVDSSGKPTDGNSGRLTFTNDEAVSELIMSPITLLLKQSVNVLNDELPVNLNKLQIFLEEGKEYSFRFRLLRYSTEVQLAMSFIIPGDKDPSRIIWNDVTLGDVFLGEDDESVLRQKGDDIIGYEVSGTIVTNSESGLFIPQVRQTKANNKVSVIKEAFLEVRDGSN